jgi:hypothetical protein
MEGGLWTHVPKERLRIILSAGRRLSQYGPYVRAALCGQAGGGRGRRNSPKA